MNFPKTIAIGSVSGGGKTTAVSCLEQTMKNVKALYFDDYDFKGPSDILTWLDRGANSNEWDLQPMLDDLEKLRAEPLDYVFLDFPFANQHESSKNYIDFTVFINTPLDLALSRRVLRDFSHATTKDIMEDIRRYEKYGRAAYLHMLHTIKPNSDLVIDGDQSKVEIIQTIQETLNTRFINEHEEDNR